MICTNENCTDFPDFECLNMETFKIKKVLTLDFHQILLNGGHTGSTCHPRDSQEALF